MVAAPPHRRADRPARAVTDEQRRALNAVACLTLLHGRPPTLDELSEALGVAKDALCHRLHWLRKKGLWLSAERSREPDGRYPSGTPSGAITRLGLLAALGMSR
jgi:hypothetical protein